MLCRERREISLIVLLVNCHDVKVRIFRPMNFAPNRYEKSFRTVRVVSVPYGTMYIFLPGPS